MVRRVGWARLFVLVGMAVSIGLVLHDFDPSPVSHAEEAAPPPAGDRTAPVANPARLEPWTGSRFAGTPEAPPPYTVEPAFPHLRFENPVVLVRAGGTRRLFLGDLKGRIWSFPEDPACRKADMAMDVSRLHPELTMFYGLTCHPKFEQNRYVYVCYVLKNDLPGGSVVSRFEASKTDPPVIDPKSEQVILTFWSGGHNGGCLEFGNDGYLYISTGDGSGPSPPDTMMTGQDCSDLLSSILRVDVDNASAGKSYAIPADNPFVGTPGVRPEIWAYGLRNPWKMSIDHATGDLWVGDVGWELWETIDKVERGGNYGWSVTEGPQPVHVEGKRGPTPISPPTVAHPHSEAASITGGYVYRGSRIPGLTGAYLYGDYQTGTIWGLRMKGKEVVWNQVLARTPLHLAAFGETHDGELYLVDHDRTHQIYRLVPNPAASRSTTFPRRLSQTGLFASTREHRPAMGVVPYAVNTELWSDGATAERLLAIPGGGRIGRDKPGTLQFPDGSVLARTISVETMRGNPTSRRRVETQILHLEADAWRPYSYAWTDDQTDATLVDAGGASLHITSNDSKARSELPGRDYRVHARVECILCHNPWVEKKTTVFGPQSASPLGVNTAQLNRTIDVDGMSINQLQSLHQKGLLSWTPSPDQLPRLANPYDESADLNLRARSYLQAHCAYCHQFNAGGAANIALGIDVPLDQTRTVGVRPIQGTFNIAGARIIAAGEPERSVLYYRVSKLGGGRMPRIGSNEVDIRASRLIHDWIAAMKAVPEDRSQPAQKRDEDAVAALRAEGVASDTRSAALSHLASSTRGSLLLLDLIDRVHLSESLKNEAVSLTRKSPHVEVRDLFERFVPESERIKRLGDAVNRSAILSLKGDLERGRAVFAGNPAAQCKTCHRVGNVGEPVGPELTKIGGKYDRASLLDHILEPSRTIDPQYATYLVETKDGQVVSGLLAEKTEKAVVLKDAQGKTVRVPRDQVEQFVPQSRSLMPELLLRDLTAQQVADLLDFLASLK